MGVNDGSVFVITLAMVFLPGLSNVQMILLSMVGSALGAGLVFGFGSLVKNGLSPVRLAIIGTVIGTFLSSIASAVAMFFQISQNVSVWYNSKLHTVNPDMLILMSLTPYKTDTAIANTMNIGEAPKIRIAFQFLFIISFIAPSALLQ